MTPEDVLAYVEKAWMDGYDTARATLRDVANVTTDPQIAMSFRLAVELLDNVQPKSKGWAVRK